MPDFQATGSGDDSEVFFGAIGVAGATLDLNGYDVTTDGGLIGAADNTHTIIDVAGGGSLTIATANNGGIALVSGVVSKYADNNGVISVGGTAIFSDESGGNDGLLLDLGGTFISGSPRDIPLDLPGELAVAYANGATDQNATDIAEVNTHVDVIKDGEVVLTGSNEGEYEGEGGGANARRRPMG